MPDKTPVPTYNVVIIQPPGYVHSLGFLDLGRLLQASFQSLGFACTLTFNQFHSAATNIILGYHLLRDVEVVDSFPCVVYQLEQLPDRGSRFDPRLLAILRRARAVWDYAPENIDFLAAQGLPDIRLVPIGFHERLRTITPTDPDIDVLFFGSLNDRRCCVLTALSRHCKVKALFGVYQEERDREIARSRIILNIHFYPAKLLEQVRLSYLLNNGCFVVTEESKHNPYAAYLVTAPYDDLAGCCLRYLKDAAAREQKAAAGFALFQQRRMVDHLCAILTTSAPGAGHCILTTEDQASTPAARPTRRPPARAVRHLHNPLDLAKNATYYQFDRKDVLQMVRQQNIQASRVLELGCGAGRIAQQLRQTLRASYYVGIDSCEEAVREAGARLDKVHWADIEQNSGEELGLRENEFDLLVALDVLEHLRDPWGTLAELVRFLRPGGRAVLSIPNVQNIRVLANLAHGKWAYESSGLLDSTHLRFFTLESIHPLITGAGLTVLHTAAVLNPAVNVQTLAETGNTIRAGKLTLSPLTRDEVIRLHAYQYLVVARRH